MNHGTFTRSLTAPAKATRNQFVRSAYIDRADPEDREVRNARYILRDTTTTKVVYRKGVGHPRIVRHHLPQ